MRPDREKGAACLVGNLHAQQRGPGCKSASYTRAIRWHTSSPNHIYMYTCLAWATITMMYLCPTCHTTNVRSNWWLYVSHTIQDAVWREYDSAGPQLLGDGRDPADSPQYESTIASKDDYKKLIGGRYGVGRRDEGLFWLRDALALFTLCGLIPPFTAYSL